MKLDTHVLTRNWMLVILALGTGLLVNSTHAQDFRIKSLGLPFIEGFTPTHHKAETQSYDIIQGDDGRMYIGNYTLLLVYDGQNWIHVVPERRSSVNALCKTDDGALYLAGQDEIGYLRTSVTGKAKIVSLSKELGAMGYETFNFRRGHFFNGFVHFIANDFLVRIDPATKDMEVMKFDKGIRIHVVSNNYYAYRGDSLYQYHSGTWKGVRKTRLTTLANSWSTHLIEPIGQNAVFVSPEGFYDFESDKSLPLEASVAQFLINTKINSVDVLVNRYLAIATNNGLLITDLEGRPMKLLNKESGLTGNYTTGATVDSGGSVWVTTTNGIDRVELFSQFTLFDKRMGVEGTIGYSLVHEGELYLSGATGYFVQNWSELQNPMVHKKFDKVGDARGWQILSAGEDLIAQRTDGAFLFDGNEMNLIPGTDDALYWRGIVYPGEQDVMMGSLKGNLLHLRKVGGEWTVFKKHETSMPSVHYMEHGDDNVLWISEKSSGIYRVKYDVEAGELLEVKKYGTEHGLPSEVFNFVYTAGGMLIFCTYSGPYEYVPEEDRFRRHTVFGPYFDDDYLIKIFGHKDLFFYDSKGFNMLRKTDDGYNRLSFPGPKVFDFIAQDMRVLDSANLLYSTFDAVVHLDPSREMPNFPFKVNISKVELNGYADSLLFAGFGLGDINPEIDYDDNDVRFEFAAAFYENTDHTAYQWKLEGQDDQWSNWSRERRKDYTNLPHGSYVFKVRAKNVYENLSEIATYNFAVLPPWYHTWWAYVTYLIGFIVFMRTALKFNARRLEQKNIRLEGIVKERTSEILEQKEQAERDAETISGQHDKLLQMAELKSRFFLNISHELRTPLTLAMGTVDQAIRGKFGALNDEQYANLKVSYRNSERLLKMVNNILDVSKLEGGKMQLYAALVNTSEILNKVVGFFASKFHDKGIELKQNYDSSIELFVDRDKFETVFINLIANAFKFTPEGGQIELNAIKEQTQVIFTVRDTGVGIPVEDLPFVFDRFYQSRYTKSGEGTGVGLALSKELVELHGAYITANSDGHSGTEFRLAFPTGKAHLASDQLLPNDAEGAQKTMDDKYPLTDQFSEDIEVSQNKGVHPTEQQHILLVEDNYEMRKFLNQMLRDDFQVSMVQNGKEAIEFLESGKVDLILTDYLMPVMDGFEMATEIKKNDDLSLIPMIFLTARAQEQDKIDVLNLGVDDYLFKPFSADELKARISNLLRAKKQRAEYWIEKSIDPRDIEWKEFPSKLKLDIDQYLEQHIKDEITGEDLAQYTQQSERSLYRKVKANTGYSLMQYIKEYRLRKARALLENRELKSVSEVAYAVGFNYLSHFTKAFKERFGKSPSEYLD